MQTINLILSAVGITLTLIIGGAILLALIQQRRELLATRRTTRQIKNLTRQVTVLAVLIESDQRRTRHALKNLAAALRLQQIVAALEEPPDNAIYMDIFQSPDEEASDADGAGDATAVRLRGGRRR